MDYECDCEVEILRRHLNAEKLERLVSGANDGDTVEKVSTLLKHSTRLLEEMVQGMEEEGTEEEVLTDSCDSAAIYEPLTSSDSDSDGVEHNTKLPEQNVLDEVFALPGTSQLLAEEEASLYCDTDLDEDYPDEQQERKQSPLCESIAAPDTSQEMAENLFLLSDSDDSDCFSVDDDYCSNEENGCKKQDLEPIVFVENETFQNEPTSTLGNEDSDSERKKIDQTTKTVETESTSSPKKQQEEREKEENKQTAKAKAKEETSGAVEMKPSATAKKNDTNTDLKQHWESILKKKEEKLRIMQKVFNVPKQQANTSPIPLPAPQPSFHSPYPHYGPSCNTHPQAHTGVRSQTQPPTQPQSTAMLKQLSFQPQQAGQVPPHPSQLFPHLYYPPTTCYPQCLPPSQSAYFYPPSPYYCVYPPHQG
eukprot:GCRY01005477.1.p1 GENE.GCRY01005477.1~~GCRY01005477.1.p1  ORF type:complete len:454 (-),score=88.55 GCRY01005477.1:109-1371(-)